MDDQKNIAFVRLDILENWRFWNTFAKTNDFEAAGREVIAQANALLAQDYTANERVTRLLEESKGFQSKRREAGRKGGLAKAQNAKAKSETQPPNQPIHPQPQRPKQNKPPTTESVYDFARSQNLDEADAREWYEINYVDRPGCDKDGVVIKNWKGHCKRFCESKAKRRQNDV